jgi:IS5 family transposase
MQRSSTRRARRGTPTALAIQTHQTKKGKPWLFGTKAQIGADDAGGW